jgi:hypothetical protein
MPEDANILSYHWSRTKRWKLSLSVFEIELYYDNVASKVETRSEYAARKLGVNGEWKEWKAGNLTRVPSLFHS